MTRVPVPALALACLAAAGCMFGIGAVELDGSADAEVPDLEGGGDAKVPDLANADLLAPGDFSEVPDGALPGALGWPCSFATDCVNGLCVDGFCCSDLCDPFIGQNLCKACNVPGFEGRCTLALDGTDPRGQCDQQPVTTCGRDGLCDGKGGCRSWPAGTACTGPSCAAGAITYPAACDGVGHCAPPAPPTSCAPFRCADATSCATGCSKNGDCSGSSCGSNGSCGPRALGQPCLQASDCASAVCAEGVCCNAICNGICTSCAIPGSIGTCSPAPPGTDPLQQCVQQPRSTCGREGKCDGAGACRYWASGTACAAARCAGGNAVSARACDGLGSCAAGTVTDCDPFACDAINARCFAAPCSSSAQCSTGKTCKLDGSCG